MLPPALPAVLDEELRVKLVHPLQVILPPNPGPRTFTVPVLNWLPAAVPLNWRLAPATMVMAKPWPLVSVLMLAPSLIMMSPPERYVTASPNAAGVPVVKGPVKLKNVGSP